MSPEEESFARTQDTRVQQLHNMYVACGARTNKQNKYFKDVVRNSLFNSQLNFICAVIYVLEQVQQKAVADTNRAVDNYFGDLNSLEDNNKGLQARN